MRTSRSTDEELTATELRRALIRLGRRLRAERPDGALSSTKLSVLGHLRRHGPSRPVDIAQAEHQQPQSLSRVFADLEDEGLILRTRGVTDRREYVLSLTAQGQDALTAEMARRDAWLASALEQLSELEVQLLALTTPLLDRLADTQ